MMPGAKGTGPGSTMTNCYNSNMLCVQCACFQIMKKHMHVRFKVVLLQYRISTITFYSAGRNYLITFVPISPRYAFGKKSLVNIINALEFSHARCGQVLGDASIPLVWFRPHVCDLCPLYGDLNRL